MDDFKFNFLSRGQLESLSLDKFFLTVFKISPLLLECSAEIFLITFTYQLFYTCMEQEHSQLDQPQE